MSVRTPENQTAFSTDVGGRHEPNFSLNNTIVIARPINRIIPHIEPQRVIKEDRIDPEKYLASVSRLQAFFDSELKIKNDGKRSIKNYNPVLERVVWEHLQTDEERKQFKIYEIKQIETALRERYHVATSVVIYDIDEDNKLRSRDLPNQAFEDVLVIGIEYYRQLGSPDVERMEQERVGILKIQETFTDPNAPANLKAEVISGSGLVEGTIFTDNFLDRYKLLEDSLTQRRIVQMTRFSSDLTYEQAEEIITTSKPDYFEDMEGPKDRWLLSHPIFEAEGGVLIPRKNSLKEADFQKIVQGNSDIRDSLIDTICAQEFLPEEVALALNAFLNGADYIWEKIVGISEMVVGTVAKIVERVMPVFKSLEEKINWLGHQVVRAVAAGCGLSDGYSIGGVFSSVRNFFSGFISKIFVGSSTETNMGFCKKCGGSTEDNHYHCPKCPAKYKDETNVSSENRTKSCKCGFKFGC